MLKGTAPNLVKINKVVKAEDTKIKLSTE